MEISVAATLLGVSATVMTIIITFHRFFEDNQNMQRKQWLWLAVLLCVLSAAVNFWGMLFTSLIYITSLFSAGLILFLLVLIVRMLKQG